VRLGAGISVFEVVADVLLATSSLRRGLEHPVGGLGGEKMAGGVFVRRGPWKAQDSRWF